MVAGLFGGCTGWSAGGWVVGWVGGWVGGLFRTWESVFAPVGGGPVLGERAGWLVGGWVLGSEGGSLRASESAFVRVRGGPVIILGGFAAVHTAVLLLPWWLGWSLGGWLGRRVGMSRETWVGVFVPVHRPALAYFGCTTSQTRIPVQISH